MAKTFLTASCNFRCRKCIKFCCFLGFSVLEAELNKAGPFVEYERRIAASELVDGDTCQV